MITRDIITLKTTKLKVFRNFSEKFSMSTSMFITNIKITNVKKRKIKIGNIISFSKI